MKRLTTTMAALAACLAGHSANPSPAQAQVSMQHPTTLTGRLTQVMAIGGETTGWALQTARGQYEIDLPPRMRGEAARYEGRPVRVQGYWSAAFGPERGQRRVLRVQALWPVQESRTDGRRYRPEHPRQRFDFRPPVQRFQPGYPYHHHDRPFPTYRSNW